MSTWRVVRLSASALLVITGSIHLDLYLTGYQTIPTIGWLFLFQVISAFALAFAVAVARSRLFAFAGAGFVMSTLVGYLVSLRVSLFGFREVRTTAGVVAGVVEIIGFAVLASLALRPARTPHTPPSSAPEREQFRYFRGTMVGGRWIALILTVGAAVSLAWLSTDTTAASSDSNATSTVVKVAEIHGVAVLTNAHGYTLYWFAPDTSSASHCYGTCAAYWPPVIGTPSGAAGVTGTLATVKRSNGALQATYNGHPLYTYIGDAAPGQSTGDRINLNGGRWYEMKEST